MNQSLFDHLVYLLSLHTGQSVQFLKKRSLSGGCINNGFEMVTNTGSYFIKTNTAKRFPGMFEAEAAGLIMLAKTGCLRIPSVVLYGEHEDTSYLILEFIRSGNRKTDFWDDFGFGLASLHKNTTSLFGLDHNNYIGSITQSNKNSASWSDFFINQRLYPLLLKAEQQGLAEKNLVRQFEHLFSRMDSLIPDEKPALLHGDLWGGNVLSDETGSVCLIDPAIYYGHREADLAFSTLFGAFPHRFYDSYNTAYPLEKEWQSRIDLFNLYPLLVHLLLFGSSYYGQIKNCLTKYL